jgi:hypothetical protein
LNHIVGFGMKGTVSSEELTTIENLYSSNGIDTEIDLCPHVDASAIQVLASHGYNVNGFINNYVRILTDVDLMEDGSGESGIKISRFTPESLDKFPDISLAGYRDGGRPEVLLKTLGRIAAARADTCLYLASINGKLMGSAGLALIETTKGGVAHLYIDSTLPEYRGQGCKLHCYEPGYLMQEDQGLILLPVELGRRVPVPETLRGLASALFILKQHFVGEPTEAHQGKTQIRRVHLIVQFIIALASSILFLSISR